MLMMERGRVSTKEYMCLCIGHARYNSAVIRSQGLTRFCLHVAHVRWTQEGMWTH